MSEPLSIGTLRAGDWPSSVPEELVCEGRYGVAPGEYVPIEELVVTARTLVLLTLRFCGVA